jgi:hypothetical protein
MDKERIKNLARNPDLISGAGGHVKGTDQAEQISCSQHLQESTLLYESSSGLCSSFSIQHPI